jgi:hypothetical protein
MSVNSNQTASQQNMKKFPISTICLFIAGIVDTGDKPLLLNISANFREKFRIGPHSIWIHDKT